jgi:SNF2 family DNA or RNA helicase
VVRSTEDWLELEPGFPEAEGFCPIEEHPAPGVARARGRIYLHRPDELESFLAKGVFRVGTRELPTLSAVEQRLEDPEHPALRRYRELRRRLAAFDGIQPVSAPSAFVGTLRPYQQAGLSWLWFLHRFELGGILADDMGLGKTVQVLALLALARSRTAMRRCLVLCPVSTLANWRAECLRFVPRFRVLVHAGPGRARRVSELEEADLILAGYDTLRRDLALFRELPLDYLVLDEAQAVKNPSGKRRQAVADIAAPHRLALTGTPVENGVLELWSVMDLVMPGLLGSRSRFSARYGSADAEESAATRRLAQTIRPLVLRRTKAEVAPELPAREEQLLSVELRRSQAGFYESLRRRLAALVEASVASHGLSDSGMIILEAMLRLRQAAILPALLSPQYARIPSAKLELLMDLLADIGSEGKKALVFSQFTAVLDDVETRLGRARAPSWYRLDGSTPQGERAARIAAFQAPCRGAYFLISLRAGGLGINLTEADYVILLDPWWNPAVEAQAIDRAHRIGRRSPVIAYRIIAQGTIEEKLLRLQARKRRLAESLISSGGGGASLRSLTAEELEELFAP